MEAYRNDLEKKLYTVWNGIRKSKVLRLDSLIVSIHILINMSKSKYN